MNTFRELKKYCDLKIKEFPQYEKLYKKEILLAKRYYDNEINLYEELKNKEIKNKYIIPFLLGFTNEIDEFDNFDMVQIKPGASGGIDVDSDLAPSAKEKVFEYLQNKYGEDRVISVGTTSRLGPASAAKDLLRVYKVDFKESNKFTSKLEKNENWESNLRRIKETEPTIYKIYEKYKDILDLVPYFINKSRGSGKHAGGVLITDRPVYELIPVERVSGLLVSAYPESGQETTLDELGIVKLDILAISILDVISQTLNNINEKLYLIEDDDGIQKIVGQSYIDERIKEI